MNQNLLFEVLQRAVSPSACVELCSQKLEEAGFETLDYSKEWELRQGGKYLVKHHDTTLFAFCVGKKYRAGDMVRMAAAHTDYPCFRIKPNADFVTDGYAQVNVEVYGGPILNTWLDRPLGVVGRVALKSENVFEPKMVLYCSQKPLLIIPNLAIHMNREVNKGVELNRQTDLMPILELLPKEQKSTDYFLSFLAKELGVAKEEILDFELNTYCVEEPCLIGAEETLLSSPRLDNQTSVYALLSALLESERAAGVNLIALFDHEEIGSKSKQGAGAILLHDMLQRILRKLGNAPEQIDESIYTAMLLSVDVAHALHPNKKGKMDITNQPVLGQGFCIKESCSQSYATDAQAVAIVCQICEKEQIPCQRFVNRSDSPGGSTLGSIASSFLPVKTVDIGIPILAMHSARELMGKADIASLERFVKAYFQL